MKDQTRLYLLPATACVFVALIQFSLTNSSPLSTWKLGGFGMFSSINHRVVTVQTVHQEKSKRVNLRGERFEDVREILTKDYLGRIEVYPSDGTLEELKDRILESRFALQEEIFNYIPSDFGVFFFADKKVQPASGTELESFTGKNIFSNLTIKVFQKTYDKKTQLVDYRIIKEKTYDL